jgi:hypothetical protein
VIDPITGQVLTEAERGELVFTSLAKEAMPVMLSARRGAVNSDSLLVNGVHAASESFWDCGFVRSVPQRGAGGCPVRWRTSCRVMIMVVAHSTTAS